MFSSMPGVGTDIDWELVMTSQIKSLLVPVLMLALVGCADDAGDESDETNDALAKTTAATITTTTITVDTPKCKVNGTRPVAKVNRPAVDAALAKGLKYYSLKRNCTPIEGAQSLEVTGAFEVVTNKRGILSVTLSESSILREPGKAHKRFEILEPRTLDLRTGERLGLSDVVNADGVEIVRATCLEKMADVEDDGGVYGDPGMACNTMMLSDLDEAPMTIDDQGLHLLPGNAKVMEALGSGGILIPWSRLDGKLKGAAAKYAAGR
jgi:hypothetical protein